MASSESPEIFPSSVELIDGVVVARRIERKG